MSEDEFAVLERDYAGGITTHQIVDAFASRGYRLTEATFRKYVQLGLLPHSVRTGRKGKHRGSQGLYPPGVVRRIDLIRRLMSEGLTIEEIQTEFPFLGGEIDALHRQLDRVLSGIERSVAEAMKTGAGDQVLHKASNEARAGGDELIGRLRSIEQRLVMRARMARAAV